MRTTITFSLACACALAGCGGSGAGGSGRSVTVPGGKPIAVTATEYRFDPATITVTGGGNVRFELKNAGSQAHDLHVLKGGQDVGGTPVFGPGQAQGATVKLSPGTYDFVCTVGNHADLGMKGKLIVR